ncbi:putative transcriptional regulator [Rhizobiales bacterium GAS191]|jgi:putative transcriptional regulator|nr:putative transcriptional regulator [Rhizobiales bacterium GAS113]SEB92859.1 putative transcriptional regulator [Rhizobiales bacterium GAS188]SED30749.1 putative transcriptional regulator [Rhizobiales bacterium GAS191]
MTSFGKRLLKSVDEARAIARGEADPSTYRVRMPPTVDVKAIRKRMGLTQAVFAARFGIPLPTLRDWEQRRRAPEGPSRVLLTVIDREPEAVERALAEA